MADSSALLQSVITGELYRRPTRAPRPDEELLALRTMMRSAGAETGHLLQRLAEVAMVLCHADGAAVSLQRQSPDGRTIFYWAGATGCGDFLHQSSYPEADSLCQFAHQQQQPVLIEAPGTLYAGLHPSIPEAVELLLMPWTADSEINGTLAVFACDEPTRFDVEDLRKLASLTEVAMATVRSHTLEDRLRRQAAATASAELANELAHQINNPLQALTNTLFLLDRQHPCPETSSALFQLNRISTLVAAILELSDEASPSSPQLPLDLPLQR